MSCKIDLAYFFDPKEKETVPRWNLGQKRAIALPIKHLKFTVDCMLEQTNAEWILFWDFELGEPNIDLIKELASSNVDVWHGGLKLGTGGHPEVLSYVEPAWIYNLDSSKDVTHTNFRLSLKACLIKVSVLKKMKGIPHVFQTLDMAGLAFGYELLRRGGVIRYHADFINADSGLIVSVSDIDQWIFLNKYFPKKWQLWTVFNKRGFFKNITNWLKVKGTQYCQLLPDIHSSKKTEKQVEVKTVSVLAPTLDRYNYLYNELEELSEQTILPHEVLVTDQTDKDRRLEIDTDSFAKINVKIFQQDEKGQCVAWNKLLDEAKGEYVLFLGDDADGISRDFIEKLLQTAQHFNCDMVAANVYECGGGKHNTNPYYYHSDTFPITLIKRALVNKAGNMNMFFNRNVRADFDLAARCHLLGAFMIFDPSAEIGHHRAPVGGLRAHKARVITNYMSKNMLTKVAKPTSSELYLVRKYFSPLQFKIYVRMKLLNQIVINGSPLKKILRLFVILFNSPSMYTTYKRHLKEATVELNKSH